MWVGFWWKDIREIEWGKVDDIAVVWYCKKGRKMSNLVITNIRVPEEEYGLYKKMAEERGVSFAELVREALAEKIKQRKEKKRRSLWEIDKYAIRVGGEKASLTVDEIVYGGK